jgi:hypothetical protein
MLNHDAKPDDSANLTQSIQMPGTSTLLNLGLVSIGFSGLSRMPGEVRARPAPGRVAGFQA